MRRQQATSPGILFLLAFCQTFGLFLESGISKYIPSCMYNVSRERVQVLSKLHKWSLWNTERSNFSPSLFSI